MRVALPRAGVDCWGVPMASMTRHRRRHELAPSPEANSSAAATIQANAHSNGVATPVRASPSCAYRAGQKPSARPSKASAPAQAHSSPCRGLSPRGRATTMAMGLDTSAGGTWAAYCKTRASGFTIRSAGMKRIATAKKNGITTPTMNPENGPSRFVLTVRRLQSAPGADAARRTCRCTSATTCRSPRTWPEPGAGTGTRRR